MADYSDLSKRVWTASLIITVFLSLELLFAFIPEVRRWYGAIAVFLALGCSYEVIGFSAKANDHKKSYLLLSTIVPPLLAFIHMVLVNDHMSRSIQYLYLPFFIALLCVVVSGYRVIESAQLLASEIFISAFLIGSGGTALVFLASQENHFQLYWLILVVIANDIGAYFFGKRFGKEKIAPTISPGKTIAGSIGGLISGAAVGFLAFPLALMSGWSASIFAAIYVGICSQLGDLAKSYLKRLYGVKDTGTILPGHGGLLDRLDGILAGGVSLLLIKDFLG